MMTKKRSAIENPLSISIARQPIFDEKRRLWGYSLVCVGESGAVNSGQHLWKIMYRSAWLPAHVWGYSK